MAPWRIWPARTPRILSSCTSLNCLVCAFVGVSTSMQTFLTRGGFIFDGGTLPPTPSEPHGMFP